ANSTLMIKSGPRWFSLAVQSAAGGFADQMELVGPHVSIRGSSASETPSWITGNFPKDEPESVIFRTADVSGPQPGSFPVSLVVLSQGLSGAVQISGIQPQSLRFIERRAGGASDQSPFTSSLIAGELTVVPTGSKLSLGPTDMLELTGIRAER